MSYWTLLNATGEVVVPCIEADSAPDPSIYGGTVLFALDGPVDPATMEWTGTGWADRLDDLRAAAMEAVYAIEAKRRAALAAIASAESRDAITAIAVDFDADTSA